MQKTVKSFLNRYNLNSSPETRYIDLVSEIGELGKEILNGSDYGHHACVTSDNTKTEIGDCLFSLLALCCELDIDSDAALDIAMRKYASRFENKGHIGSGI